MGGIVIKTIVWPAPTHKSPAARIQIVLGNFSKDLFIRYYEQEDLVVNFIFHNILIITGQAV